MERAGKNTHKMAVQLIWVNLWLQRDLIWKHLVTRTQDRATAFSLQLNNISAFEKGV